MIEDNNLFFFFKLAVLWVGRACWPVHLLVSLGFSHAAAAGWLGWVGAGGSRAVVWQLILAFGLVLTLTQGARMTEATCLHQDSLSSLTQLVLGFQRAAREGKPQFTTFFKFFLSLHLLTASLAKLCQMTKSRVIIWESLQGYGYKEAWINQAHPCKIYPKSIKFD